MTHHKFLLTVAIGILAAMIGAWVVIQNSESLKIMWYTWKLDSKDITARKKAFEWLKTLAKEKLEDTKLKAFFIHPESRKQVEAELEPPFLVSAAKNGDLVDLKILLDHGSDVNEKDRYAFAPLHYAAVFGKDKAVRTLIEHGADMNAKDNDGQTPLDRAHSRDPEIKQVITALLRKHGAKTAKELTAEAKPRPKRVTNNSIGN